MTSNVIRESIKYWKVLIPHILLLLSFSEKNKLKRHYFTLVLFTYMVLISRWVTCSSPILNCNFFIWHEIEDIVTLIMHLRYNLRTIHGLEKKSHDQVDDFTNQRYQSRGIPSISFNYIPCQGLWKGPMELTD